MDFDVEREVCVRERVPHAEEEREETSLGMCSQRHSESRKKRRKRRRKRRMSH